MVENEFNKIYESTQEKKKNDDSKVEENKEDF